MEVFELDIDPRERELIELIPIEMFDHKNELQELLRDFLLKNSPILDNLLILTQQAREKSIPLSNYLTEEISSYMKHLTNIYQSSITVTRNLKNIADYIIIER